MNIQLKAIIICPSCGFAKETHTNKHSFFYLNYLSYICDELLSLPK